MEVSMGGRNVVPPFSADSGGFSAVVPQQPAEPTGIPDRAGINVAGLSRRIAACGGHVVAQPLVRPALVVVAGVFLPDVVELPKAEAEEVVQALSLIMRYPLFAECVRDGRPVGDRKGPAALPAEVFIEVLRELGVQIVDQEADVDGLLFSPEADVASLLRTQVALG